MPKKIRRRAREPEDGDRRSVVDRAENVPEEAVGEERQGATVRLALLGRDDPFGVDHRVRELRGWD